MSRAVIWVLGLVVSGALLLGGGLHAIIAFTPPRHSPQVVTLDQLVTVVLGSVLLVAAALILVRVARTARRERRVRAWIRRHPDL